MKTNDRLKVWAPAKCGEIDCDNIAEQGYGRCLEHKEVSHE